MNIDEQFQKEGQSFSLVPSQTSSQSLIRDAGAEKLMRRLERIEIEENECAIRNEKNQLRKAFLHLAHKFFHIGEDEVRKLEEDELNVLRHMIAYRVKKHWRILFAVNGLFCAVLGILAACVHGIFLLPSVCLVFNVPIIVEGLKHHFDFSRLNKRIEKFTPDIILQ